MVNLKGDCANCGPELCRLRVENDQLRRAALAFGELAERLNRALMMTASTRVHNPPNDTADSRRREDAGREHAFSACECSENLTLK